MRIIVENHPEGVWRAVAGLVRDRVAGGARVLGLATGRTMIGVYAELARLVAAGELTLAGVTGFNLDEYVGASPADPLSFAGYMRRHLVETTDIRPEDVHLPDGGAADPHAEAARYSAALAAAGGLDLQLLGIGGNGHIGFNEPGSPFDSPTRPIELAPRTLADNRAQLPEALRDAERVSAITVGIHEILAARECLVVATGTSKAAAVAAMIEGPVSPAVPASALRRHPSCTAVLDAAAAASLTDVPRV